MNAIDRCRPPSTSTATAGQRAARAAPRKGYARWVLGHGPLGRPLPRALAENIDEALTAGSWEAMDETWKAHELASEQPTRVACTTCGENHPYAQIPQWLDVSDQAVLVRESHKARSEKLGPLWECTEKDSNEGNDNA